MHRIPDDSRWPQVRQLEAALAAPLAQWGAACPPPGPLAAVVHSRKPRAVSGSTRWVRSTAAAVRHPRLRGVTLVSSLGTRAYELAACAAAALGQPLVLVLEQAPPAPDTPQHQTWRRDWGPLVDRPQTLVIAPRPAASGRQPTLKPEQRDRAIEALCDILVAVEVREGGIWHELGAQRLERGDRLLCGPDHGDAGTAGNGRLLALGAEPLLLEPPGSQPAAWATACATPGGDHEADAAAGGPVPPDPVPRLAAGRRPRRSRAAPAPQPAGLAAPAQELEARPTAASAPAGGPDPRPTAAGALAGGHAPRPRATRAPDGGHAPRPTAAGAPDGGNAPRPTAAGAPAGGNAPRPTAAGAPDGGHAPRPRATRAPDGGHAPRPTATGALTCGPAPRQPVLATLTPAPVLEDAQAGGWLFHYTRGRSNPWPGQGACEYLAELLDDTPGSPHTGLDALVRILGHRRLHASAHLIRGASPVCCFTDRPPSAIQGLSRWNRGQRRWTFEPYALGLRRAYALAKGLEPVRHLAPAAFEELPPQQRHLYQRHEPPDVDWTAEGEWRCAGDLDLSDAGPGDLVLLVPDAAAAARLAPLFPFPVRRLPGAWPAAA